MEPRIILLFLFFLCFKYSETKIVSDSLDLGTVDFIQENFQRISVDDALDEIRKTNKSESDSKKLLNNLINIVERYVYLDIIKKPPQPKENYFNTVDLVEKLKNVNSEERPLYDLYRDINLIISECQDNHFTFVYNKEIAYGYKLNQLFFVSPIEYEITKNGVYGKPSYLYTVFDEDIINQIKEKEGTKISKINNLDPLEYIQKINKGFLQCKSPQAQFVLNMDKMVSFSLSEYQFEKGELNDITILYEDSFNLKYNFTIGFAKKTNKQFFNYFEHFKPIPGSYLTIPDIAKSFMKKNNLFMETNAQIKWDKEITNKNGKAIKCKIDSNKGMNVIYQESFSFDDSIEVVNILIKCFNNFYKNDYPIVIIENMNGGGSTFICDYLIALVNLNKPLTEYSSFRNNDDVKKYIGATQAYRTLDTCEVKKADYFFDNLETDDYGVDEHGQKIKHYRSQIFSATSTNRTLIEMFKKSIKSKIKKPHEIIIFTDGYSFSAASDFIKTTYLAGGAIIVGYNGNPNFETFDSSQNPASVINTGNYKTVDSVSQTIEDLGFSLYYTYKEYFDINYEGNPQIPLEFQIHEIDERFEFYKKYSDDYYNDFLEEAHYIFEKYKTECNPKNKRLLLITDECVFDNSMMHGGYECGSDGKWSKTCVPSYCDNGYIYDSKTNTCIEDICLIKKDTDTDNTDDTDNIKTNSKEAIGLFVSSMVFFGLFLISLVLYIIACCNGWDKANYLFFIMIPFLILGIILVMVATLKFHFSA